MSKIGKRSIPLNSVQVTVEGQKVHFKGPKSEGSYELPDYLQPVVEDQSLTLKYDEAKHPLRLGKKFWGMHRALLANKIYGAQKEFEKKVTIVGLGYKAEVSGQKIVFSLGYSHKIDFQVPDGVTVEADKSGQNLVVKSIDKFLVGDVCQKIRALRPTEPYKGRGIRVEGDFILRKEGKKKGD